MTEAGNKKNRSRYKCHKTNDEHKMYIGLATPTQKMNY